MDIVERQEIAKTAIETIDTIVNLRAEIARLRARLDEAAKVIALFAGEAVRYEPDEGDGDDILWDKTGCLRIKHLRAAAEWMKKEDK